MENNIVIRPDGIATDITEIRSVFTVEQDAKTTGFKCTFKHLDQDCWFRWQNDKFSDTQAELLQKVKNIRLELIKRMNGGVDATELIGSINLKK